MKNPFRYSYSAKVRIKSEQDKVWDALVDFDNYHLWNPFTPKVQANGKIGDLVILTVQMKKDRDPIKQIEFLTRYKPSTELAWAMEWKMLLKAERVQRLSIDENGNTLYFTEDIIKGLFSPIVHLIYGKSIQKGFDALATALKKYMEQS